MATEGTPMTAAGFVARSRIRRAARSELQKYVDDVIVHAVAEALGTVVAEIGQRCAAIEARITALESTGIKGVWLEGTRYAAGSIVSVPALGIYRALADTAARPGGSDAWQLLLKAGRDGKDGAPGRDAVPLQPPEPTPRRATAPAHRRPSP